MKTSPQSMLRDACAGHLRSALLACAAVGVVGCPHRDAARLGPSTCDLDRVSACALVSELARWGMDGAFSSYACEKEDGAFPAACRQGPWPSRVLQVLQEIRGKMTPEVVYGEDDRHPVSTLTDPALRILAKTSVWILHAPMERCADDGTAYCLPTKRSDACCDEQFADEGVPALSSDVPFPCTGVLVGRSLVLTALHCAPKASWVVLEHQAPSDIDDAIRIPEHRAVRVQRSEYPPSPAPTGAPDWALLKLESCVDKSAPIAVLSPTNSLPRGSPVFTFGHPDAGSLKIATNAMVTDAPAEHLCAPTYGCSGTSSALPGICFKHTLDVVLGNSGSPVFDARHEIVGLQVRGSSRAAGGEACGRPCQHACVCLADSCCAAGGPATPGCNTVDNFALATVTFRAVVEDQIGKESCELPAVRARGDQ